MGIVIAVLFGPLVWSLHLLVLYGTHASVCAAAKGAAGTTGAVLPALAAATVVALALTAAPLASPRRFARLLHDRLTGKESRFLLSLMRWLAGLSLIAVAGNGIVLVIVPAC